MKYRVRMEFDVDSIDFGDIVVTATNKKDAIEKAIYQYLNSNTEVDYYSSNVYDSTLRSDDSDNWEVEEVKDEMD